MPSRLAQQLGPQRHAYGPPMPNHLAPTSGARSWTLVLRGACASALPPGKASGGAGPSVAILERAPAPSTAPGAPSAPGAASATQPQSLPTPDPTGYLALATVPILWGTYNPCIRYLYAEDNPLDPASLTAVRTALSAGALLLPALLGYLYTEGREAWRRHSSGPRQPNVPSTNGSSSRSGATMSHGNGESPSGGLQASAAADAHHSHRHAPLGTVLAAAADGPADGVAAAAVAGAEEAEEAEEAGPAAAGATAKKRPVFDQPLKTERLGPVLTSTFTSVIIGGLELGILNFLGTALQVEGLHSTSATRAGFLAEVTAVLTPLVSYLAGYDIPRQMWLAVAVGLVGSTMVAYDTSQGSSAASGSAKSSPAPAAAAASASTASAVPAAAEATTSVAAAAAVAADAAGGPAPEAAAGAPTLTSSSSSSSSSSTLAAGAGPALPNAAPEVAGPALGLEADAASMAPGFPAPPADVASAASAAASAAATAPGASSPPPLELAAGAHDAVAVAAASPSTFATEVVVDGAVGERDTAVGLAAQASVAAPGLDMGREATSNLTQAVAAEALGQASVVAVAEPLNAAAGVSASSLASPVVDIASTALDVAAGAVSAVSGAAAAAAVQATGVAVAAAEATAEAAAAPSGDAAAAAVTAVADAAAAAAVTPLAITGGEAYLLLACLFFSICTVRMGIYAPKMDTVQLAAMKKVGLSSTSLLWMAASNLQHGAALGSVFAFPDLSTRTPLSVAVLVYSGLGPGALATYLQFVGLSTVPATTAQVIYSMTPLCTALFAYLLLGGEATGPLAWAGGCLIIGAALMAANAQFQQQRQHAEAAQAAQQQQQQQPAEEAV